MGDVNKEEKKLLEIEKEEQKIYKYKKLDKEK